MPTRTSMSLSTGAETLSFCWQRGTQKINFTWSKMREIPRKINQTINIIIFLNVKGVE